VTPTKHRADDRLMIDGQPRSANRRKGRDQSKAKTSQEISSKADAEARIRRQMDQQQRQGASNALPWKPVDPFAGIPLKDHPLTAAQRSTLAALSRDPHLNFDHWQTLTRGEADRLIPRLRKLAKRRSDAQLTKPNKRTKTR
jgi:hypothetical protein